MAIFSVVGVIAAGRWAIKGWRHLEERWRSRNDADRDDGPGGPDGPDDPGGPDGSFDPVGAAPTAGSVDPPTRENQPARVVGDW
jgi:hypothetical protein